MFVVLKWFYNVNVRIQSVGVVLRVQIRCIGYELNILNLFIYFWYGNVICNDVNMLFIDDF